MATGTDFGFVIVQAGEVDQADDLLPLVTERMPLHIFEMRRPARFVAKPGREKRADFGTSGRGQRLGRDGRTIGRTQCQQAGAGFEERGQLRDPRIAGQAHEVGLLQPARFSGIEARVALRQREGAVPGDAAADIHGGVVKRFRCQAFDREAVQVFDTHDWGPP